MRAFAKTDIGKARDMNQDYYYIPTKEEELPLYILADGMGGYQGGEVASKLATTAVKNYITSNFDKIEKEKLEILKLVQSAMEYANMIVYEKSKEQKDLEGMGTTLEVCLIYNNKAYIGHVGDSRIYRIRREFMRKLTHDHSYVEKLVKDGTISKEEAMHHPKKNMLMKALGCTAFVEPDVTVKGFMKEDIFLMCSDGLTNMLTDEQIYEIIKQEKQQAPDKLIELANRQGGYDNITAIVIM
ncbi:MAG: Stp1/IreP family PP2C-type Ser/Thr phosphatase [Clostridia bacterium]